MNIKKYFLIGAISLIITALSAPVCLAVVPTTKSLQWNYIENNTLDYFVNRFVSAGEGWGPALSNPNITINYNIGITNTDTGDSVACGSSVPVGTKLTLGFAPLSSTDIYWFGTGYSGDSPYGEWGNPYDADTPITCQTKDLVENTVQLCDPDLYGTFNAYIPLVVARPSLTNQTIDNLTSNISCGSISGNPTDGYSANCEVTGEGTINPHFNFGATSGKFYYRYYDSRDSSKYSDPINNSCGVGTPCVPGCYGNNIPLESGTGDTTSPYGTCYPLVHAPKSYTLNVPEQHINDCGITATLLIDGVCSSDAIESYDYSENFPRGGLYCSVGTPSPEIPDNPTPDTPSTWTCLSPNGGKTSETCSATRKTATGATNGACGDANGHMFIYDDTSYGSYAQCIAGNSSNKNFPGPDPVYSVIWNCEGSGDGHTDAENCMATRATSPAEDGDCGWAAIEWPAGSIDFHFSSSYENPFLGPILSQIFCDIGTAIPIGPVFPTPSNPTHWVCSGINGGENIDCTATVLAGTDSVCGTAAKTYLFDAAGFGSDTFCSPGTPVPANPPFPTSSTPYSPWTCNSTNGGANAYCAAYLAPKPGNAVCGTAAKTYPFDAAGFGSDTFCSAGTSPSPSPTFPAAGYSVTWICNSTNGGTYTSCTAYRDPNLGNGKCGGANKTYPAGSKNFSPEVLCANNGTAIPAPPSTSVIFPTASNPTTTWRCKGTNGTYSPTCTATLTPGTPGVCGGANKEWPAGSTFFYIQSGSNYYVYSPPYFYKYSLSEFTLISTSYFTKIFCDIGTAVPVSPSTSISFPTASNPTTTWVCKSPNSGADSPICTATINLSEDGACGWGAAEYPFDATAFTPNLFPFCSVGTANPIPPATSIAFPTSSTPTHWTCKGTNGVDSPTCTATRAPNPGDGKCGTANHKFPNTWYGSATFSPYTLCVNPASPVVPVSPSTSLTFPTSSNPTHWVCEGINGGEDSNTCTATIAPGIDGACGWGATDLSGYTTWYPAVNSTWCLKGTANPTPPPFPTVSTPSHWVCIGTYGGENTDCTATRGPSINGVCGSANGVAVTSKPTANLCSAGTASAVTEINPLTWNWKCISSSGGTTALCASSCYSVPVP